MLPSLFAVSACRWRHEHGDMGTWGHGDMGTWGCGDMGTWGHGDVRMWGHGDMEYVDTLTTASLDSSNSTMSDLLCQAAKWRAVFL